MSERNQTERARDLLVQRWDAEGMCESCNWHAALGEYDITDDDIADAMQGAAGVLCLPCLSADADDADIHRGVRVRIV
jgi:hypothetical protein